MNQIFINASEGKQPIYSPRNLIKLLSRTSDEEKKESRISKFQVSEITKQFDAYLKKIEKHYAKHKKNRLRERQHQAQEQMHTEVKLAKIPIGYFNEEWKLGAEELGRRSRAQQKQEQLQEFLDQIQLIIFRKTSKYPDKAFLYMNNVLDAEHEIEQTLNKIQSHRKILKQKINIVILKQKMIQKKLQKKQRILEVIEAIKSLQKVKKVQLALQSSGVSIVQQLNSVQISHLKNIKIGSVQNIVQDYHQCEEMLKEKYLKVLKSQLSALLNKVLCYSKDQWIKNQIPDSALNFNHNQIIIAKDSNNTNDQKMNASMMNISILDQSYFQVQNECVELDYQGIMSVWNRLQKMKIDAQQQMEIVELILRELVRNNAIFNRDLQEYINYVFKTKGVEIRSNRKSKHEDRIEVLDIKFYLKIVSVYFNCLRNVLEVIRKCGCKIAFIKQAEGKVFEFIKHRVQFFLSLRSINEQTPIQDVAGLCNIIDFWVFEQELEDQLSEMRVKILEQYSLIIHTYIQVNCLKRAIQVSDFKPISIPSQYFMPFDFILSWQEKQEPMNTLPSNNILEESISIMPDHSSHFRIIDKKIIIQGSQYRICDSFLELIIQMEKYLQIKVAFMLEMQKNIDEKICEIVGFYCWYNRKILMSSNREKSVRDLCLFISMCQLLRKIVDILNLSVVPKRLTKLNNDISESIKEIMKEISKVPLQLVETQISRNYQSKLKKRVEIPTIESKKIIEILLETQQGISLYFPEKDLRSFLEPSIKMITKNYFGYLLNLDARGKAQLKWFIPKFKQAIGYLFPNEIRSAELLLR